MIVAQPTTRAARPIGATARRYAPPVGRTFGNTIRDITDDTSRATATKGDIARKAFFKDPGNGIACGPGFGHEPHYPPADEELLQTFLLDKMLKDQVDRLRPVLGARR